MSGPESFESPHLPAIQIRFPRSRSPYFAHVLALAKLTPVCEPDYEDHPTLSGIPRRPGGRKSSGRKPLLT